MVYRPGRWPGAGHRGFRFQFNRRGDRTVPSCGERRSRRRPDRDALLQQADAGRPLPALQSDNDAIGIPIIIYNIPGRSIVDMSVETMARLFELKNVAGVKDATANMARVSQQRAAMGTDFNQLSGEDITALGFMAHGGHGCISVTSNVAPRLCAEFQAACLKGDFATALKLQDKLAPLHINLFVETSPAPIKYAMSLIGKCANTVRLPMVPASEKAQVAVRQAMVHAGLIN